VSAFFSPDVKGEPPNVRMQRLVRAKRVCARCPVRELCRSYALENEEEFGVWGGLSEIERKHLIAERRGAQTGQRIP
jgi:WhiB family redox-sensing transcriptional regulator